MKLNITTVLDVNFDESFEKLMNQKSLSGFTLFKLRKMVKAIKSELKEYHSLKQQYVNECAVLNNEGLPVIETKEVNGQVLQSYQIVKEKIPYLNKKLEELNSIEIEIEEIKFSELGSHHELTAKDISFLEFITE